MQKSASVTRDALEILTFKTIAEVQLPLMFAIGSFPDAPCCSNPKTGTRLFYKVELKCVLPLRHLEYLRVLSRDN